MSQCRGHPDVGLCGHAGTPAPPSTCRRTSLIPMCRATRREREPSSDGRSNVACESAQSPIRVPPRSSSVGCSGLGQRSVLVASISTRFLRQSWSSCMPVWCDSRGWTEPSSLRWLDACWPETSPARADNGFSGSSREARHHRGWSRAFSHLGATRCTRESTHHSLTTPLAIPHGYGDCGATSCYQSRRSFAPNGACRRGGWYHRAASSPAFVQRRETSLLSLSILGAPPRGRIGGNDESQPKRRRFRRARRWLRRLASFRHPFGHRTDAALPGVRQHAGT
jgi:hypothetical protein